MNTIKIECKECKGTGLYVGMAERDGAAIVCHKCKGAGCVDFEYEPFQQRKSMDGVLRVYQTNPGICIGCGKEGKYKLEDFGGMPVEEWKPDKPFPAGTEMRKFTCPTWWYQCADYRRKPDWEECMGTLGARFSECPHFPSKDNCWKRFDAEKAAII